MPSHLVTRALAAEPDPPPPYAWIITVDHLSRKFGDSARDESITGPSAAEDTDILARVRAGDGLRFRLYDDDGELYYSGRLLTLDTDGHAVTSARQLPDGLEAAPIHDFGEGWAGAIVCRWAVDGAWIRSEEL